ncbi:MAG: CBS domain-containing protein [Gemmatimonadetes bacterium]|nr:CBS domain-containing protein [Gemmatimonadota bacterium]
MKIGDILRTKGREVATIAESQTVLAAARVLVERNIGSLVVMEGRRPVGIFTERDILRLAAREPSELDTIQVGGAMTKDVITANSDASVASVMDVMTENRIRHVPIMAGDELVGIVSIGDLVNACRVSAESENSQLRQYIQGGG